MIKLEKVSEIETSDLKSGMYFLVKLKDYVVVNNQYLGFIVYDIYLNKVFEYTFPTEQIIHRGFPDCSCNRLSILTDSMLLYIDIDTGYTSSREFCYEDNQYGFLSYYKLGKDHILLYTSSFVVKWDFVANNLNVLDINTLENNDEAVEFNQVKDLLKSSQDVSFLDNIWIVYKVGLEFYRNRELFDCRSIDTSNWYKFDLSQNYFMSVDEFIINIGDFNNKDFIQRIVFDKGWACHGAVLLNDSKDTYLIILLNDESVDDDDVDDIRLRSYRLSTMGSYSIARDIIQISGY